jgi:3-hydroxy-9,10-secoandrosta-1,3,5(10)-triene-9,17-dione monooxygenase
MSGVIDHAPLADADTPARQELVSRARELYGAIRDSAQEAEGTRHLPDAWVAAYTDAGLLRTLVPQRFGGYELSFSAALDVGIEMGRADGSAGWVLSYYTDHNYLVALWPEAAQQEVWANGPDTRVATSFVPQGTVQRADGGYVLTGRWPWSSGIRHSDWVILGGLVFPADDEGHPHLRLFLVPQSDFTVHDVWHNAGLAATGSDDVSAADTFVPEHRTVDMALLREGQGPGTAVNPGPIYAAPIIAVASYALLGPAIGAARGGLESWMEAARAKVHSYTGEQISASAPIQIRLAHVAAQIDAAELLVRRCLAEVEGPGPISLEIRVRNRRDWTMAIRMLVAAMDELIQAAGASGMLLRSPIQRAWRDVHTISAHVTMNFEAAAENYGRAALGLPLNPRDPFF